MSVLSMPCVARAIARLLQHAKPRTLPHLQFPDIAANTRDISIPTRFGAAVCTVYHPPESSAAMAPVHVNFHGGGFVIGHPFQDDPQCRYLAARGNIVVVNVDYVLAPQHPFPTAVHQAYDIVRWVAEQGTEHRWDGSKLSVGGQSAGGSIAAAVARQALDQGGPRIGLQFLHYPPLDLVTPGMHKPAKISKTVVPRRLTEILDSAYIPKAGERAHPLASPAHGSNADAIHGIAPAFVVTAEFDLLHDEGVVYAEKLRRAGALVEHWDLQGVDHAYNIVGKEVGLSRRLTEEVYERLITHIKAASVSPLVVGTVEQRP